MELTPLSADADDLEVCTMVLLPNVLKIIFGFLTLSYSVMYPALHHFVCKEKISQSPTGQDAPGLCMKTLNLFNRKTPSSSRRERESSPKKSAGLVIRGVACS